MSRVSEGLADTAVAAVPTGESADDAANAAAINAIIEALVAAGVLKAS